MSFRKVVKVNILLDRFIERVQVGFLSLSGRFIPRFPLARILAQVIEVSASRFSLFHKPIIPGVYGEKMIAW